MGSMGDNWSDGYGKYRDRRGTGSIGKALDNPHLQEILERKPFPWVTRDRVKVDSVGEDAVLLELSVVGHHRSSMFRHCHLLG